MSFELYTEDRLEYHYYPVTSNMVSFRIRAPNDAHIILTSTQFDSVPCYEIFFGGWKNTKSVIRKDRQQPDVAEVMTPNILNPNDYKGFWIRWDYGVLTAGVQGDINPILKYQDAQMFPIQFFGVCTGWGASGQWIIDNGPQTNNPFNAPPSAGVYPQLQPQPGFNPAFGGVPPYPGSAAAVPYPGIGFSQPTNAPKWIPSTHGTVPPNAVVGGNDVNGEPIYIIRAHHEGSLTPGKLVPSHRVAYIPWGGRENPKDEYEVLCDCTPRWVSMTGGNIPPGALVAGQTETNETLYVGRVNHEQALTVGKVQASHGTCYIPFGGNEVAKNSYEILTL